MASSWQSDRPGISDEFPDDAVRSLVRVAAAFDLSLILVGLGFAATGRIAGGLGVAMIGVMALVAVLLLRPDGVAPAPRSSAGASTGRGGPDRVEGTLAGKER